METNNKENLTVVIEVKAKDYKNGIAVSSMEADAKLKVVFGGIHEDRTEKSIIIRGTTCSPTIEADYNSAEFGRGESKTNVEFDLKGKTYDVEKKGLVDGFSASANIDIVKEDVGEDKVVQDWFKLKAAKDCGEECATVESYFTTKTNDI
jgi:hypothetical protein